MQTRAPGSSDGNLCAYQSEAKQTRSNIGAALVVDNAILLTKSDVFAMESNLFGCCITFSKHSDGETHFFWHQGICLGHCITSPMKYDSFERCALLAMPCGQGGSAWLVVPLSIVKFNISDHSILVTTQKTLDGTNIELFYSYSQHLHQSRVAGCVTP